MVDFLWYYPLSACQPKPLLLCDQVQAFLLQSHLNVTSKKWSSCIVVWNLKYWNFCISICCAVLHCCCVILLKKYTKIPALLLPLTCKQNSAILKQGVVRWQKNLRMIVKVVVAATATVEFKGGDNAEYWIGWVKVGHWQSNRMVLAYVVVIAMDFGSASRIGGSWGWHDAVGCGCGQYLMVAVKFKCGGGSGYSNSDNGNGCDGESVTSEELSCVSGGAGDGYISDQWHGKVSKWSSDSQDEKCIIYYFSIIYIVIIRNK